MDLFKNAVDCTEEHPKAPLCQNVPETQTCKTPNFEVALKLLEDRYANRKLIVHWNQSSTFCDRGITRGIHQCLCGEHNGSSSNGSRWWVICLPMDAHHRQKLEYNYQTSLEAIQQKRWCTKHERNEKVFRATGTTNWSLDQSDKSFIKEQANDSF